MFHNEFFVGNRHQKERITDSHIGIGDKRYHAECQSSTDGKLEGLLQVYKMFAGALQHQVKEDRLTEYEKLVIRDMTVKVVSSLAAKWDHIKKGVEDIMGGEILELEVDKILDRGKAEGLLEGMIALVRDGLLDLAEGAKRANITQEEFERKMNGE